MFAEMPLDNRTVDKFAAVAATLWAFSAVWNVATRRNDLIFRRDW